MVPGSSVRVARRICYRMVGRRLFFVASCLSNQYDLLGKRYAAYHGGSAAYRTWLYLGPIGEWKVALQGHQERDQCFFLIRLQLQPELVASDCPGFEPVPFEPCRHIVVTKPCRIKPVFECRY
jgi:hypothetical protein